jgi:hypothetical protein
MGWQAFSSKLNAAFNTGALQKFQLVKPFGVSGRVTVVKGPDRGGVRIVGANRTARASGWDIRAALGLKDSLFRVDVRYDGAGLTAGDEGSTRTSTNRAGTSRKAVAPPSWQTKAMLSQAP